MNWTIRQGQVSAEKRALARVFRKKPTETEQKAWSLLRGRRCLGLKFRRQQPVAGFIADFYCAKYKIALEIDGLVHEEQKDYDAHRDQILLQHGIRVLRIKNEQVNANALKSLLLPLTKSAQ